MQVKTLAKLQKGQKGTRFEKVSKVRRYTFWFPVNPVRPRQVLLTNNRYQPNWNPNERRKKCHERTSACMYYGSWTVTKAYVCVNNSKRNKKSKKYERILFVVASHNYILLRSVYRHNNISMECLFLYMLRLNHVFTMPFMNRFKCYCCFFLCRELWFDYSIFFDVVWLPIRM